MANLNERTCVQCNKLFSLVYTDRHGYKSILNTTHCSKSCAVTHSKGISKETLEKKALDYIRDKNEYCTSVELCNGINHSSKTLTKHGIHISSLNESLGFVNSKSKFQDKVGEFLKENFTTVETEKKFDGLVGTTGHPLRVDFYIPEINTVVEADGDQHSNPEHPWSGWSNGTVASYDKIKNQYFDVNGINLIRIPYKRNLKKSDILSHLN